MRETFMYGNLETATAASNNENSLFEDIADLNKRSSELEGKVFMLETRVNSLVDELIYFQSRLGL